MVLYGTVNILVLNMLCSTTISGSKPGIVPLTRLPDLFCYKSIQRKHLCILPVCTPPPAATVDTVDRYALHLRVKSLSNITDHGLPHAFPFVIY
jgi:hypothetical protein